MDEERAQWNCRQRGEENHVNFDGYLWLYFWKTREILTVDMIYVDRGVVRRVKPATVASFEIKRSVSDNASQINRHMPIRPFARNNQPAINAYLDFISFNNTMAP